LCDAIIVGERHGRTWTLASIARARWVMKLCAGIDHLSGSCFVAQNAAKLNAQNPTLNS
jgi:hypothetical protein